MLSLIGILALVTSKFDSGSFRKALTIRMLSSSLFVVSSFSLVLLFDMLVLEFLYL